MRDGLENKFRLEANFGGVKLNSVPLHVQISMDEIVIGGSNDRKI